MMETRVDAQVLVWNNWGVVAKRKVKGVTLRIVVVCARCNGRRQDSQSHWQRWLVYLGSMAAQRDLSRQLYAGDGRSATAPCDRKPCSVPTASPGSALVSLPCRHGDKVSVCIGGSRRVYLALLICRRSKSWWLLKEKERKRSRHGWARAKS